MSLLIVDDDSNIRDLLTFYLSQKGYTVAAAANGSEALTWLRQSADLPKLILLDLMMPVMSGAEFRTEQRQDPALASIPVAVISAAENLRDKAPALDADAYLAKPIDFEVLVETVERYCSKHRQQNA